MNIIHNYHVYKYDTGGSHDLHVSGYMSQVILYLYIKTVFYIWA